MVTCWHEDCRRQSGWPTVCLHPEGGNYVPPTSVLLESKPIRYRVKGQILELRPDRPGNPIGRRYDVDLIVEPQP
jgi:hypothetical protein